MKKTKEVIQLTIGSTTGATLEEMASLTSGKWPGVRPHEIVVRNINSSLLPCAEFCREHPHESHVTIIELSPTPGYFRRMKRAATKKQRRTSTATTVTGVQSALH